MHYVSFVNNKNRKNKNKISPKSSVIMTFKMNRKRYGKKVKIEN